MKSKSDQMVKQAVSEAIESELLREGPEISVQPSGEAPTLYGAVEYHPDELRAGSSGHVLDKFDAAAGSWGQKNDKEIKAEVLNALLWNWNTPEESISADVSNGWVTLSGSLEWNYQKEAARALASRLIGVKGVTNSISIRSADGAEVDKESVARALHSHAGMGTANIRVAVSGRELTLSGHVDSLFQKELAMRIAWKAPGVLQVINDLSVEL